MRQWKHFSSLHGALLVSCKGAGATDAVLAQWAETVGLAAARQCLDYADAAARWDDGLWNERRVAYHTCSIASEEFLAGGAW